jgi:integrase
VSVYVRGNWYWYKRMLGGHVYYRPLKIRKGQESLLSARLAQIDDEITSLHLGLDRPTGIPVRLSEYRAKFLEAKKHKKTIDRDRQRLLYVSEIWPDLPLNFYGKAHVEALEKKLSASGPTGRPSKPATLNRYMELLRSLFNLAIEDGLVRDNPMRFYQPFAEEGTRRALSEDELRAVLDAARSLAEVKRFRLRHVFRDLILFGLATGMRLSEILNLRRSWISGDALAIPLASTKSRLRGPSASKQRVKVVGLNDIAFDIIGRQPIRDDYVFDLHRRDVMVIQHGVEAVRRITGIKDFTFHHLRHTVSTLVASQSSLATARVVLGHADLRTTLHYTHPSSAERAEAVTKLGTYLRGIVSK